MKYVLIFLLVPVMAVSQSNSAIPLEEQMAHFVNTFQTDDTMTVLRAESGILSINNNSSGDYTTRKLYSGNSYLLYCISDANISDFKLRLWKKNSSGDWIRADSTDKYTHATSGFTQLGDKEILAINPSEDADYAFQLLSVSSANKTGRYGMILMKSPASTPPPTSTHYSCDTRSFAYVQKNATTGDLELQGTWETKDESCLFEINSQKTQIKHTTATMTSTYFVDNIEDGSESKIYKVTSDVGNSYTFFFYNDNSDVMIYGKDTDGKGYLLKYHIKTTWQK